jgi:hypothetical protein
VREEKREVYEGWFDVECGLVTGNIYKFKVSSFSAGSTEAKPMLK